jgi:hypothetical protein
MVLNRIYSVKQLYYLYYSIYIYIYKYKEEWSICIKKPQRPPMEI